MARAILDKKTMGQHLRELRIAKGKTVSEVSQATGIGETALRNYENGLRVPRYEAMFALSKYFQRSIDTIFFKQ